MRRQDGATGHSRWMAVAVGVALVAALAGLTVIAYRDLFGTVSPQDDDGYVIASLRLFADGGAPYDEVYSQYGPGLFSLVGGAMHVLGIPFTTDGARFVNLALWIASAGLAWFALLRLTRSVVIAFAGMVLCFLVLNVDAHEPLHPGALIGLLLVGLTAAASAYPERRSLAMGLLGGLAAVLLTLKANAGVFAFAGIGVAFALVAPPLRRLLPLRIVAGVAFAALPLLLISAHFDQPDTQRLGLIVAAGALALVAVASQLRAATAPDWRDLGWFCLAAAATLGFVIFVVLFAGTSPGDLVDYWFIRPSETPDLQFAVLYLASGNIWWAIGGLTSAALAALLLVRRTAASSAGTRAAIAVGRLAAGAGMWLALSEAGNGFPNELSTALVAASAFSWVAAVPRFGESPERGFVRVAIPAVAVLQAMHAYPVPGSQIGWSVVLFVIVGGICIGDGIAELRELREPRAEGFVAGLLRWAPVGAVAVVGLWICAQPLRDYTRDVDDVWAEAVSLDLPGAEKTRLSSDRVNQLHAVVDGLESRCSTYVSLPGLNSFYTWTGQTPPTVLSGPWAFFLTEEDQQEIVDRISGIPRLCLISKPDVFAFWAGFSGGMAPDRPLVRFMRDEFVEVADYDGYSLGVRRESASGSETSLRR